MRHFDVKLQKYFAVWIDESLANENWAFDSNSQSRVRAPHLSSIFEYDHDM